ncbi:MAG TPA: WD40 repeat domain-containing protein [Gemmataceae bacterium]|nr:WD40 repeat domain-containing protein [Gemmataceae bacterium]
MAGISLHAVIQHLRRLHGASDAAQRSDRELLHSCATNNNRDAFALTHEAEAAAPSLIQAALRGATASVPRSAAALGVAAGALMMMSLSAALHAEPPADSPKANDKHTRRVNLFGDPLPPGAVARLGTMRLRYATCMAISPDGKVVATAQGSSVHLWDAASGKFLRRLTAPHSARGAYTIAFSPDGRKIAVMDHLGLDSVVWEVDKANLLFATHIEGRRSAHHLVMARIVFSPDSKTLYTGNDQTVHGWDVATGKETACFQHGKPNETRTNILIFSRDGKRFATASDSQSEIRLWDLHAGKRLHVLDSGALRTRRGVRSAAFSSDGRLLATGGADGKVRLWNVKSGKGLHNLGKVGNEAVDDVAFTPDGKTLAVANKNPFSREKQFIRLWNLDGDHVRLGKVLPALGLNALAYFPDGKTLAWICCEQSVRLLDAATGQERLSFASHYGGVNSIAYSPDGRLIATASDDCTIRLWNADTSKPKDMLRGHGRRVNALAYSPDGKCLASASSDGTAILWDMETRKMRFRCEGHGNQVRAVAFSPDGKTLVIGGYNSIIQSWDVRTGKELRTIEQEEHTNALAFSPDGALLAGGSVSLHLYDARTARLLRNVKTEPTITSLAFSPDGRTLACGGDSETILWELASGKERARLPGHWNQRGALAFSPDGKLLASGSHDMGGDMNEVVHVWELATGKELGAFRGHEQPVFGVAFSPDGKRLATASGDATTLIWNLAAVAKRGPHPAIDKRSLKSPLAAADLEAAWSDLASADAVQAQQAIWKLVRAPRQAAAFLGQRLRLATKPKTADIAARIADLDSERFSTRERASAELTRLGTLAETILRKKRAEKISLELRKRLDILLEKLDAQAPASAEDLRPLRAVEVLEHAGTPEARQVLRTLAGGAECARLTREAKASLRRLETK